MRGSQDATLVDACVRDQFKRLLILKEKYINFQAFYQRHAFQNGLTMKSSRIVCDKLRSLVSRLFTLSEFFKSFARVWLEISYRLGKFFCKKRTDVCGLIVSPMGSMKC